LGIDRFVDEGVSSAAGANLFAFRILCGAFVLIAVLGLAIPPPSGR
jgi:hypothetical protein